MLLKICWIICLPDRINKIDIIYWSLIKYKQVICSILIIKFYKIALRFDIRAVLKAKIEKILRFAILSVLYINSKFFYNCLIKLYTT